MPIERSARDAAKYLADQSVVVAGIATKLDDGSVMQKALILRSEIIMDCATMLMEWLQAQNIQEKTDAAKLSTDHSKDVR